jgi:ubiquinone/menaquinone biosynthesis C-methylase UbiE
MIQVQTPLTQNSPYILGHAETELNRLIHQARFFGELSAQILNLAGLKPGMRVLDSGCGAGDLSFLAASLVGPEGAVIGVDRSPEAIALASQRAAAAGLTHVHFLTQDLSELSLEEPVDALVGRLVLMYFADPAVLLRRLVSLVNPGGIVAFHEIDMDGAKSEPTCRLFETAVQRIKQTFSRVGADIRAGLKLARIFQEAGLPTPQMIQGARVECGPDALIYDQVAQVTRTLLPLMQRTGVATAEEVEVDTLAARIREEAVAKNATLVSPILIGAWTRKGE